VSIEVSPVLWKSDLLVVNLAVSVTRYDLKLWTGTLHESATYPPA
jgi:hypothetical protein